MNTVADSLFSALMSWVRALVGDIWAIFSSDHTTILEFLGKNWLLIALALIAFGLAADWLIWLLRWQPYHLWAQRARRILRIADPEEDEDDAPRAHAAVLPDRRTPPPQDAEWLPLPDPVLGEDDARQAMSAAAQVPDDALGVYPGMRYDGARAAAQEAFPSQPTQDTLRYAAVHAEGPGAAEVDRRRAEIDAWQLQMREEARAKAEAEAEQARLLREAQAAEQARRAAEEAERRRRAEEEAERQRRAEEEAERQRRAEEEAARQRAAQEAQARYAREMAEYEVKRAQYERDMAEYKRQKAEYDAQMARLAARDALGEGGKEVPAPDVTARRRRAAQDVPPEAEQVEETAARETGGLKERVARMAQMIEPEQTDVVGIKSLPPRVDPREAYGPAARPPRGGRRRR